MAVADEVAGTHESPGETGGASWKERGGDLAYEEGLKTRVLGGRWKQESVPEGDRSVFGASPEEAAEATLPRFAGGDTKVISTYGIPVGLSA
jgi:hypothetical protein